MLRVVAIEPITPFRYLVSIDRDGHLQNYAFSATAPEHGTCIVSPPEQLMIDLDDYLPRVRLDRPPPGPSVLLLACNLVRKLVLGQEISLPVVLDER